MSFNRKVSMRDKGNEISELLAREGFNVEVDNDGNMYITPTILRFNQIKVQMVRRGRYITDPNLVPPELQDKNILWIDEPPKVTAITLNGEEIPIFVEQVSIIQDIKDPDDKA